MLIERRSISPIQVATAVFLLAPPAAVGATDRPSVLFFSADDMWFGLGAFGAPYVTRPHLDRLAADGAIFLQAHRQYPLCAPLRASLLTGRGPHQAVSS